ncbi:MAG: NAD(P)/FAD-dependent oxidoreductase [Bellilinea sp.]|jgi:phytoene dehydrogenase-like protein
MGKVAVIGAGIAGLTAGVYALQSGFDVTIYEAHAIPGGASTGWRRNGYLFEGGMHWLTGSSPGTPLNKLWHNVGALDDTTPVYYRDPFLTSEYNGQSVHLYRNVQKLRQHLISVSPEDEKEIINLVKDVKKFAKVTMPITDIKGVKVKERSGLGILPLLRMLPAFIRMPFYAKQAVKDYSLRFRSPVLQQLLQTITTEDYLAVAMIFTLATLCSGDGGYPAGGSLGMAKRIADKVAALGGTIKYNTHVSKVLVRDDAAVGVVIDGREIFADAVIVTQDTRAAIDTLFDTPLREPWAEKMRKNTIPLLNTFISLGVETDLSDLPERLYFNLDKPFLCGGQDKWLIGIHHYSGREGYAPNGCTAITSAFVGDTYDFWKQCKLNGTYETEKQKLAEAFIAVLENKWPQIKGKVAVWDVATPLTYERYLQSYKGSWMSLLVKGRGMESYPTKPEKIKNLYFAGQRLLSPGGLPAAAETGRKAVQYLCVDTNTVFQGKKA